MYNNVYDITNHASFSPTDLLACLSTERWILYNISVVANNMYGPSDPVYAAIFTEEGSESIYNICMYRIMILIEYEDIIVVNPRLEM